MDSAVMDGIGLVLGQTDGEIREYIPEFLLQLFLNPVGYRPLTLEMAYIRQDQLALGCLKIVVLQVRRDVQVRSLADRIRG